MHSLSMQGFLSKKFLGLRSSEIGSAGIIGKSSGVGKCVTPKVCQRTMSVLAIFSFGLAAIHSGKPLEGKPEV